MAQAVDEDENSRRGAAAQSRVERGQISRARHELIGAPLAPQTSATLDELRARRSQESSSPISREVMDFAPESFLSLDGKIFAKCLRTAPWGCSPGREGGTNEILRVCLDDAELLGLLSSAAEDFARAAVPVEDMQPFMLAPMSAGLPLARVFGDLSRKLWRANSVESWKKLVHLFSLPFPPRPGWIVLDTQFVWQLRQTQRLQSCPMTGLGLMITCIGAPC